MISSQQGQSTATRYFNTYKAFAASRFRFHITNNTFHTYRTISHSIMSNQNLLLGGTDIPAPIPLMCDLTQGQQWSNPNYLPLGSNLAPQPNPETLLQSGTEMRAASSPSINLNNMASPHDHAQTVQDNRVPSPETENSTPFQPSARLYAGPSLTEQIESHERMISALELRVDAMKFSISFPGKNGVVSDDRISAVVKPQILQLMSLIETIRTQQLHLQGSLSQISKRLDALYWYTGPNRREAQNAGSARDVGRSENENFCSWSVS
ncbi:hypothetical protein EYR41_006089 [Orbilia oligospora]|uniref:Uncharacterized protein n=1 Tax=Orbilia oligospora TaxID=2813651 RepID=A0A8H2E3H5_ORBOL|nr:hypothetical protein EYR41_006089 [Orbilia oligospora]